MSSGIDVWLLVVMLRAVITARSTFLLDVIIVASAWFCLLYIGADIEIHMSLQDLPLYCLIGFGVFVLSVVVTTQPTTYLASTLSSLKMAPRRTHQQALFCALYTATAEELMWRVTLQSILSISLSPVLAIIIVAIVFTTLHRQRSAGFNHHLVEMLLFSMLLGTQYALTHDLLGVIAVHAIRNYLVTVQGSHHE